VLAQVTGCSGIPASGRPEPGRRGSGRRGSGRRGSGRRLIGYLVRMVALLLVAAALGLDNFAASIAFGVTGVDARMRLRVGLVFGVFEAGMPVAGLAIGHELAGAIGTAGRWAAAALLIATGAYGLVASFRGRSGGTGGIGASPAKPGRLILSGLALSLDNLAVGFALGTYHVSIIEGALIIGLISVSLALIGLELGARIGNWAGERGEQLAGVLLISVGIAIAAGVLG
jgi:manganese efflux pump family protein